VAGGFPYMRWQIPIRHFSDTPCWRMAIPYSVQRRNVRVRLSPWRSCRRHFPDHCWRQKTRCAVGENKSPKVLYETAVSRSSGVICHCGKGFLMSKRLLELQSSGSGKSRGLDRREAAAFVGLSPEAFDKARRESVCAAGRPYFLRTLSGKRIGIAILSLQKFCVSH
jgi:hypothetical protein